MTRNKQEKRGWLGVGSLMPPPVATVRTSVSFVRRNTDAWRYKKGARSRSMNMHERRMIKSYVFRGVLFPQRGAPRGERRGCVLEKIKRDGSRNERAISVDTRCLKTASAHRGREIDIFMRFFFFPSPPCPPGPPLREPLRRERGRPVNGDSTGRRKRSNDNSCRDLRGWPATIAVLKFWDRVKRASTFSRDDSTR